MSLMSKPASKSSPPKKPDSYLTALILLRHEFLLSVGSGLALIDQPTTRRENRSMTADT